MLQSTAGWCYTERAVCRAHAQAVWQRRDFGLLKEALARAMLLRWPQKATAGDLNTFGA